MTVDLPQLIFAVFLLWLPRQLLRLGGRFFKRRRSAGDRRGTEPWNVREPGDPHLSFRVEFTKFRNYLDLLRAGAGSLAFSGGMGMRPCILVPPDAMRETVWSAMGIRAVILLIGLLIQTVRYEKNRFTFYPPIFYLAGLSVGLCDIRGAIFAFVLIWAMNPAVANAQAFLTMYALMMIAFGHFYAGGGDPSAIYSGVLCFFPVLLSLLSKRPLTVFTRKAVRPNAPS